MLNLGLEHLNQAPAKRKPVTLGSLYLDAMAVEQVADSMIGASQAVENLITIRQTIKKYGFTKSVEALIGREQAMHASIEGIKEMWHSFVEWLKKLWNKFTAFIYRIFGSIPGMIRSLKSAKERFGRASEAGKSFTDKWMVPGWFKAFDKSGAADKASALAEQLTKDANWEEEQKKIDELLKIADSNSEKAPYGGTASGAQQLCDRAIKLLGAIDKLKAAVKTLDGEVKKLVSETPKDDKDAQTKAAEARKKFGAFSKSVSKLARLGLKFAGIIVGAKLTGMDAAPADKTDKK